MKYLKMLALAAMACTALMAFASTASATTLRAGGTSGTTLAAGSIIVASLKAKTSAVLSDTSGLIQNTCVTSEVRGKTAHETGIMVTGPIETLTFVSCTRATKVLAGGSLSIENISGTDNGTVSGSATEVETVTPTVYGTSTSTSLGTLIGASSSTGTATLVVNAVLPLIKTVSGSCVTDARWKAEYTVTGPLGLVVIA